MIQNMNLTTGEPFNDGAFILYVNGEYRGNDDLGKLMHDFNCTDADDMNFDLMAERTRYLKENPEGVSIMCKAMEDMRKEAAREAAEEARMATLLDAVKKIMKSFHISIDEAMNSLEVSKDDQTVLMKMI